LDSNPLKDLKLPTLLQDNAKINAGEGMEELKKSVSSTRAHLEEPGQQMEAAAKKARAQVDKTFKNAQAQLNDIADKGRKDVEKAVRDLQKEAKDAVDKAKDRVAKRAEKKEKESAD
jgi:hypothetical protein